MRRTTVAAIAAAGLALAGAAQGEPLKVVSENPATPPGYKAYVVHSDRIGRDFVVTVHTSGAVVVLPGQKLPAVYALDGGYGMAGPQGVMLSQSSAMEPSIIVSVGYLPGQTTLRNTDLMHSRTTTPDGVAMGGGGAAFEAFLLDELKPFIEAKYPADPKRSVLFGHSAGGLFAANVFADKPDAFYGYIIGSASAWADPTLFARVSAAAARAHGQHVYLSVGEMESAGKPGGGTTMIDGYTGLLKALRGHPGVILEPRIYAGETHASYYPRLVTDGFRAVLPPAPTRRSCRPRRWPSMSGTIACRRGSGSRSRPTTTGASTATWSGTRRSRCGRTDLTGSTRRSRTPTSPSMRRARR